MGKIIGIGVLLLLALVASFLGKYLPGIGSITLALLLAILTGFIFSFDTKSTAIFKFAEKNLLAWATILLGFGLNLRSLSSLSPYFILILVLAVIGTLLFSRLVIKFTGERLAWLLGAGNGICGNSAIGATAPLLQANVTEIGLAVATVNLLGTLGILLFPSLANWLGYDSHESALFIGAILQSVGHVVAAGYTIDPATGAMALLIKMGRILLLGPVILIISLNMKQHAAKPGIRKLIPYYVWGFLGASLLTSSQLLAESVTAFLDKTGSYILLLAMIGIGLGINIRQLLRLGPATLFAGASIFLLQLILVAGLIFSIRLL